MLSLPIYADSGYRLDFGTKSSEINLFLINDPHHYKISSFFFEDKTFYQFKFLSDDLEAFKFSLGTPFHYKSPDNIYKDVFFDGGFGVESTLFDTTLSLYSAPNKTFFSAIFSKLISATVLFEDYTDPQSLLPKERVTITPKLDFSNYSEDRLNYILTGSASFSSTQGQNGLPDNQGSGYYLTTGLLYELFGIEFQTDVTKINWDWEDDNTLDEVTGETYFYPISKSYSNLRNKNSADAILYSHFAYKQYKTFDIFLNYQNLSEETNIEHIRGGVASNFGVEEIRVSLSYESTSGDESELVGRFAYSGLF